MRAQEFVTEIERLEPYYYSGGKDELERFQTPGKKRLRPLPGGSDLLYTIRPDNYGSNIYIVEPGIPGITKPTIVASLSLVEPGIPITNAVKVGTITVDEDYRGRGLAKALYGIVLTIMKKILISGDSQTPGGRRNWLSLANIPGVEVKGLVQIIEREFDVYNKPNSSGTNELQVDKKIDQLMQLGGQFIGRDKYSTYWAFDVVPGKGELAPAVKNSLSKIYGYDAPTALYAKWEGS
jgi:GNAT superfamily N-acetyltransferase